MWITFAILSAIFAGLTSILAKCGIYKTDSDVATALRTIVVLIFTCLMVFISKTFNTITEISYKSLLFLILSGIATGASWLCYYYAIQNGIVSVVVSIDKMSLVITIIFSYIIFKEKINRKNFIGLVLIMLGIISMSIFK